MELLENGDQPNDEVRSIDFCGMLILAHHATEIRIKAHMTQCLQSVDSEEIWHRVQLPRKSIDLVHGINDT